MSATSRKSLTPLRSCCKTFSEKTRALAAWYMASQAFRSAPRSSWNSLSRWRGKKGTFHGTPDFLSHDTDRWALHLLPRGWSQRRAGASPTARTSLFIADVRAALRPAFRSLSPCRARLPGLRTQRLAGPENIRVYVRSLRRDHESLHRSARALALHAVHAGLRRPRGFSHGPGPSGPDRGSHRPGCGGAQRRPGGELGAAASLLGRSRRQRKHAAHESPLAGDHADTARRERSQRRSLRPGSLDR